MWERVKGKILIAFNDIAFTNCMPDYFSIARVVTLSKDSTEFPAVGDIRTIAVLPAITKLLETCILIILEKEIVEKNMLHPNQSGFRHGQSCLDNLVVVKNFVM